MSNKDQCKNLSAPVHVLKNYHHKQHLRIKGRFQLAQPAGLYLSAAPADITITSNKASPNPSLTRSKKPETMDYDDTSPSGQYSQAL